MDSDLAGGIDGEDLVDGLEGAAGSRDDVEVGGNGGAVDDDIEGSRIGLREVDFGELQFDVVATGGSGELVLEDAVGPAFSLVQGGVGSAGNVGGGGVGGAGGISVGDPGLSEGVSIVRSTGIDAHQSRGGDQGGRFPRGLESQVADSTATRARSMN